MYMFMDKKLLSTDTGLPSSRMRSPITRVANDLQWNTQQAAYYTDNSVHSVST